MAEHDGDGVIDEEYEEAVRRARRATRTGWRTMGALVGGTVFVAALAWLAFTIFLVWFVWAWANGKG